MTATVNCHISCFSVCCMSLGFSWDAAAHHSFFYYFFVELKCDLLDPRWFLVAKMMAHVVNNRTMFFFDP